MSRRRLVLAAVVTAALTWALAGSAGSAPAAGTPPVTERVSLGAFTASLRLDLVGDREYPRIRGAHLRVTRDGSVVVDRTVPLPGDCRDASCARFPGTQILELRRLDTPDPIVLLWWFTGGAHCCSILQTVALPGGRIASIGLGNGGGVIRRVDGSTLLRGQDERFPYRYTSYASSGSPITLRAFRGGRFVDVTGAHPSAVRDDATRWWKAYVQARSGGWETRGVFAAWAADACLLGQRARVEARLADGVARGWYSPPRAEDVRPFGAAWARLLLSDLVKLGYCPKG